VQIYARNAKPTLSKWDPGPGGWQQIGSASKVHARQQIHLTSGTAKYRYFLVWITSLGGHMSVDLNEVALYR
jgi:hypothetical protein